MELTGNVSGIIKMLGGGEGSTVTIEPLVTSGLQIAKVTIDEEVMYLYIPTPQDVDVDAVLTSGTKIAEITINEEVVEIYAPSPTNISVTPALQSGTKIADISVNGVNSSLYAPGHEYSTTEHIVGIWTDGRAIYERTITLPFNTNSLVNDIFYYCDIDISQILPNISHGWVVTDMSYFIDPSYPNDFRSFIMASFINVTTIELWTSYQRSGNATLTVRYTKNS